MDFNAVARIARDLVFANTQEETPNEAPEEAAGLSAESEEKVVPPPDVEESPDLDADEVPDGEPVSEEDSAEVENEGGAEKSSVLDFTEKKPGPEVKYWINWHDYSKCVYVGDYVLCPSEKVSNSSLNTRSESVKPAENRAEETWQKEKYSEPVTFQQAAGLAFDFGRKADTVENLAFGGSVFYGVTFAGGKLPDWLGFGATIKAAASLHRYSPPKSEPDPEDEAGSDPLETPEKPKKVTTEISGVSGFFAPEVVFQLASEFKMTSNNYSSYSSSSTSGTSQIRVCPAGVEVDYREITKSDKSKTKPVSVHYGANIAVDFFFASPFKAGEFAFGFSLAGYINDRAEAKGSAGLIFAF